MAKIRIDGIYAGESPSQYLAGAGQYLQGIGIDPDLPISDAVGDRLPALSLRPAGYGTFSSTLLNSTPLWLTTTPKTSLLYAYLSGGRLVSYSSSFASETTVGTPSSGAGNGFAYYNNYLYLATPTNITRYGPLDGAAALTDSVWTGATLGTQTALVNTTYPSMRGSVALPNHAMHVHVDGKLYFCDYDSTSSTVANRGKGIIHFIKTKYGSAEGDTNDSSTYNALDLPFNFMPVDIESYGTDLVIAAIQTTNGVLNQGKACLFFWNTTDDSSYYRVVELPDPLVTGMKMNNGILYVFSGGISNGADSANGYRVSRYLGGSQTETIFFSNSGQPPFAGAIDVIGDRVAWGTFEQLRSTTAASPEYYGVVKAIGSKDPRLPMQVHTIINSKATATAGDGVVTAILKAQQDSFSNPGLIVGWRDSTTQGLDKKGTTYGTHVWRSQMVNVGGAFALKKVRFNFPAAIAANHSITPKIFVDDFSSSSTTGLTGINNTNYTASQRSVEMFPTITGDHNFCLELRWSGSALLPVLLPIEIEFEVLSGKYV